MSLHIEAKKGDIAEIVFITGDPLRAKNLAEGWLQHPVCCNHIRGMFVYTGTYKGKPITIQGTGMGIPSTALYMYELIHEYKVSCIIRVGTCGAIQKNLALGQVIVATEGLTDSSAVAQYNRQPNSDPKPDAILFAKAKEVATALRIPIQTGSVFSTDLFYSEDVHRYEEAIEKGVLAVDMETSMVYAMSSYFSVRSLSLLTVSDNILTGEALSSSERELRTNDIMGLALATVFN